MSLAPTKNAQEGVGQPGPATLHLQQLIAEAHLLKRPANLQAALRMGELVHRYLSAAGNGDGSGKGPPSYRDLARAANLGSSASALCRSVQAYQLSQVLPELQSFVHVSTTHIRAVVNLPLSHQRLLLVQAEAEHWPCSRMEKAAGALRREPTEVLESNHRGRTSGFFVAPGAEVARSLSTALTHLKRAQQHAASGFPAHIKRDVEHKLRELGATVVELARAFDFNPEGENPVSSPETPPATKEQP